MSAPHLGILVESPGEGWAIDPVLDAFVRGFHGFFAPIAAYASYEDLKGVIRLSHLEGPDINGPGDTMGYELPPFDCMDVPLLEGEKFIPGAPFTGMAGPEASIERIKEKFRALRAKAAEGDPSIVLFGRVLARIPEDHDRDRRWVFREQTVEQEDQNPAALLRIRIGNGGLNTVSVYGLRWICRRSVLTPEDEWVEGPDSDVADENLESLILSLGRTIQHPKTKFKEVSIDEIERTPFVTEAARFDAALGKLPGHSPYAPLA